MKSDLFSTEEAYIYLKLPPYTFNLYKKKYNIEVANRDGHYNYYLKTDIENLKKKLDKDLTDRQRIKYEKSATISVEKFSSEKVKAVRKKVGEKMRDDFDLIGWAPNKVSTRAGIHYSQVLRTLDGKDVELYTYILIAKVLSKPIGYYLDMFVAEIRKEEEGSESDYSF